MTIVFQESVTPDNMYSFTNAPSNVLFDVHNDSPYNMGVSFGRNTGIQDADYYTSPQSVLYGVPIPGQGGRSIGGTRFSGTIYIYTQTPLGGTTTFSAAPAQSITILGYAAGSQPQGTTSLNRMANVGNPVTTSGGSVAQIVNDGNPSGTQIIESTVTGDSASAVSLTNDGVLAIGTAAHKGSITLSGTLSTDGGLIVTDGSGKLTVTTKLLVNLINALIGNDFGANVATGHKVFFQVNGTDIVDITGTGLAATGAISATGDVSTGGNLKNTSAIFDTGGNQWAAITPGATTRIGTNTGGQVVFQINGGTKLSVNTTDVISQNQFSAPQFILSGSSGNYGLYTNSLSRISNFSGTGSVTVNHNLGAAPSIAWAWCDASSSSQTMGNTFNTTQVTVTTGAGLHWSGAALRY